MSEVPSRRLIIGALIASVVSTAIHYLDNAIYIDHYPQPDWINPELVYIVWSLLTLIGIAGYLFFKEGRYLSSGLYLLVYSYTGLSSLGHYLYGSLHDFSAKMHLLIAADALTGALVAVIAVRLLLLSRSPAAV
jgi:hypothetical protein